MGYKSPLLAQKPFVQLKVIQVGWFKRTKKKYGEGQRFFLMAPLHHHYQKKGFPEPKIVTRFWIVAIILAVLSIVTLKIR